MVEALALFERADGEFTLNATTTGGQTLPRLSWISASQYVAVWTHDPLDGGSNPMIRAQIFDSDGTAAGAEFTVNLSDVDVQTNAVVARLAGGGFVVAWEDRYAAVDGSGSSIRYQVFDSAGARVGSEQTANATTQFDQSRPSVAGLEGGGFVITWTDDSRTDGDTSGLAVRGQLFDADGDPSGSEFLVNSVTSRAQTASSVTALPGGGFAIVWEDHSPQGTYDGLTARPDLGTNIAIQIFDAGAGKVGPERIVDTMTPATAFIFSDVGRVTATNPVAAMLPDGKIAVAWMDTYDSFIKTRLLNADGTAATDVYNVGDTFQSALVAPAIVVLADGGYAISWTTVRSQYPDVSGQGVRALVFSADGSPQGVEFQVNSSVEGGQAASAMLAFDDGGFLVAWQNATTTDLGAQRFRVDSGTISDIALSAASVSRAAIENVRAATLSADGALNAPFTYQLLSDPTGAFRIEGDLLVVADTELLYAFGSDQVTLTFRATDSNGNSFDEAIEIPLTDAPASGLYEAEAQTLVTIQSAQAAAAQTPELLALPDGGYFLTWVENRAATGTFEVMGQFYEADGSHGAAFIVNTSTPGMQFEPIAALLEDGNIVVVWTGPAQASASAGTMADIRAQILDPAGAKVGSEFVVNTVTALQQTRAVPTALADGGFLVTWADASLTSDLSVSGIKAQIFTAAGAKVGGELLVNSTTAGAQTAPYAAQLASGTIVIAWSDASATGGDTSGTAIRAQLLSSSGTPIGGEFLVNTTTLHNQSAPVATALADGRFVIVWSDTSEGTGSTGLFDPADIRAQIYDSSGNPIGGEILVNTATPGFQGQGSLGIAGVAADAAGGFVVTWSNFGPADSDGQSGSIKAQLFGADGSKAGDEFLVNHIAVGQQSTPTVAYLADNDLVFAWWDLAAARPGVGDNRAISARRFDSAVQSSLAVGGTLGADILSGTSGNDVVAGYGGNDRLLLQQGGEDRGVGGDGNDVIYFGTALSAGDVAEGGPGRDAAVLQGNVTVVLSDTNLVGIESLSLQSGANAAFGDTANNFYDYNVTMADGNVPAGVQLIVNGQSLRADEDMTFDGSAETDGKYLVYAGHGVDTLKGGAGNDIFYFEGGRWGAGDSVDGGGGRDSVVIAGVSGLNHIEFGAASLANIESISVNNRLASDPSQKPSYEMVLHNNNVTPGGTLILNGNSLTDPTQTVSFDGSAVVDGNLIMFGGAGNDVLKGGAGNDLLYGAAGQDQLTGGAGADIFQYRLASDDASVLDFQGGLDKIDLRFIDADENQAGDQAFTFIGSAQFGGNAGELRAVDVGNNMWSVMADTDGDSWPDWWVTITRTDATAMIGSDFLV